MEEYFNVGKNTHKEVAEKINHLNELPINFYNLLLEAISDDPIVQKELDNNHLFTDRERVIKYYNCNYSLNDTNPDITALGKLGQREFVNCAIRHTCKSQGKLCKVPFNLTPRQLDVIGEIGYGLVDKEICERLSMAPATLKNHKETIQDKTGIERKPALAVLAYKLGLI